MGEDLVKPLPLFLMLTFGLFIAGFAVTGLLIATGAPTWAVVVMQVAMAWTPTVAYAVVHRRVHPGTPFFRFVGLQFSSRVRMAPLVASILIPVLAITLIALGYAFATGTGPAELLVGLSPGAFGLLFLTNLIRGPLGEELGWRGYLLGEFQRRHSLVSASLLVGVIWGLWHVPLWLVSGYAGVDLLLYALFFFVSIVAFSVVIGLVHGGKGGNLLYAILLHQMLNFTAQLVEIDTLVVLGASGVIYAAIAIVLSGVAARSRPAVAAV